jgi:hypothetical protein
MGVATTGILSECSPSQGACRVPASQQQASLPKYKLKCKIFYKISPGQSQVSSGLHTRTQYPGSMQRR